MTIATKNTYNRRPLMLGRATDEERAQADRIAAEKVAAYQANPTAEAWAALAPDPAVWRPFCDAGRIATPASDQVAADGYLDGLEGHDRLAEIVDGADRIVYGAAMESGRLDRVTTVAGNLDEGESLHGRIGSEYVYRLTPTGANSAKYGPCEVCGKPATEVVHQVEARYFRDSETGEIRQTGAGCSDMFGHRECLESRRR